MARLSSFVGYPKAENMGTPTSRFGNYVAIGTLEPEIGIYSIDLLDDGCACPRSRGHGQELRKKSKHRAASEAHHGDAIFPFSRNRTARQMLASGSADRTVKLWDLLRDTKGGRGGVPCAALGSAEGQGAGRAVGPHETCCATQPELRPYVRVFDS